MIQVESPDFCPYHHPDSGKRGSPHAMSPITTRGGRLRPACLALTLFAFTVPFTVRAKDLDIDPSFLTIKDCPSEPGCAALVLMDETELNNEKLQARLSRRRLVKVFTAEGISEYSDIEVAAVVGDDSIRNLS